MSSRILSRASLDALGCKFWIPLVKNGRDYSGSNFNGTVEGPTINKMETGNNCLFFDGTDDRICLLPILIDFMQPHGWCRIAYGDGWYDYKL